LRFPGFSSFPASNFELVSDFGIRISDFRAAAGLQFAIHRQRQRFAPGIDYQSGKLPGTSQSMTTFEARSCDGSTTCSSGAPMTPHDKGAELCL
jgi:hypothetical protein